MLKEFLDGLYAKAEENAEKKRAKKLDLLTDGRTQWVESNGQMLGLAVPPPLRLHNVETIEDLIRAAQKWGQQTLAVVVAAPVEGEPDQPKPPNIVQKTYSVWISSSQVVVLLNDADRRETVTLDLHKSPVFEQIEKMKEQAIIDQPNLIRLLRREFRTAKGADTLLAAVRKLKFNKTERGESSLQHGNESMGKSIEMEVTGADAIGDNLTVMTNVLSNRGVRDTEESITLDLEIDVPNGRFMLRPMPDHCESAMENTLALIYGQIVDALGEEAVFYGTP